MCVCVFFFFFSKEGLLLLYVIYTIEKNNYFRGIDSTTVFLFFSFLSSC